MRVSAQAAITFLPVAVEPVNASLSTPERHSAAPVSPSPVTTWNTGCSGTTSAKVAASHWPTPGVSSLGLNTTALPAAEGVGDRAHRGEHRVVPRADDADDAEREVLARSPPDVGHHQARTSACWRSSTFSACLAAQAMWSSARAASRVASLCGLPVSWCTTSASWAIRRVITPFHAVEALGALVVRQGRPPGRRLARPGDRRLDLLGGVHRVGADDVAGARAERVEGLPRWLAAGSVGRGETSVVIVRS